MVDGKTETAAIEAAFDRFTAERKDIGIVLINQHVRNPSPFPPSAWLPLLPTYLPPNPPYRPPPPPPPPPTKPLGKLINYKLQVAERIRHRIDTYTAAFPTVLEIPSKDHPYDPEKDSVLRRVRRLFGE